MESRERVLLTGANGFIGNHVESYLRENTDWEIETNVGDLTQPLPDMGEFDYIVNLASNSSVERSVADPKPFIENNIGLMLNLLEYARQHPPKVFLQFSSVEVYNNTNPYAASKAAQEQIADAYWKTYSVPVLIARSSNIVGPGQSPDKFVPKVAQRIKAGELVDIYTTPTGKEGERVYNTVRNIASAILYLLNLHPQVKATIEQEVKTGSPIHFDIDGGEKLTNLRMAKKIAAFLGEHLDYRLVVPSEARPTYARSLAPTGVPLTSIGWEPPETLEEGLAWLKQM